MGNIFKTTQVNLREMKTMYEMKMAQGVINHRADAVEENLLNLKTRGAEGGGNI